MFSVLVKNVVTCNSATTIFFSILICLKFDETGCDIAAGYGVDIFRYWGDMGHFLKNDIRNVMIPVFENPIAISRQLEVEGRSLIKGGLQVELCRDVSQLLAAFFRPYYIERSKKPWKLFSAGWSKNKIARKLGINSTYLSGQHGFAFLRLSRYRHSVSLDPIFHDEDSVVSQLDNNLKSIVPGDIHSVLDFFSTSGSHYISSFVTGDALYQVFVYSIPTFVALQRHIRIHSTDNLSSEEFIKFFSPWYSEHVSNIMVMSDNQIVETWANNNFLLRMSIFTYPSLIKLHINPEISLQMDSYMRNNVLLHIEMRTLEKVFKDLNKRFWFQQVLDNYLKLWEENG